MSSDEKQVRPADGGPWFDTATTATLNAHFSPSDLLSNWLIRYPEGTRKSYRRAILQLSEWYGSQNLLTVTQDELQRWILHRLEKAGDNPTTVQQKASAVRSFFAYLEGADHISRSPATHLRSPRGDSEPRLGLELHEALALIQAADRHSRWAHAAIMLMTGAGLRVEEVSTARIENLHGNLLTVITKGARKQHKPLSVPVLEVVLFAIGARTKGTIIERDGHRVAPPRLWELVQELANAADIDSKISPHILRNTCATLALEAGARVEQVQQLLGHKNIATTLRYLTRRDHAAEALDAATLVGKYLTTNSAKEAP